MKTLAAVLVEPNRPLELADLEIPPLRPGQCLVEIAYSGVCRTQLGECRGWRGEDRHLPHCLGHEASGWVREVCGGIGKVKAGQAVVLSWIKGSGADVSGVQYYRYGGATKVNAGAVTTFQRFAVVSENRLTPLLDGIDMKQAALLGCPLPTGIGAVLNTAGGRPGQSVAVFGCGGVGLSAIIGAKLAGCYPVVAVDPDVKKTDLAARCGANGSVGAGYVDRSGDVRHAACCEIDIAIESSGNPIAMMTALQTVRPRGGIAVILGNARHGDMLTISPRHLNDGKQLRGSWGGDTNPDIDLPRYMRLMQAGKLDAAPLIGETFPLERVNEALAALEAGGCGRPIIDMGMGA